MADRVDKLSKINPFEEECFLIIEDNDGKPVGNINTHSCNRIDGTFQYGVGIKTEYRGKGYASELEGVLRRSHFANGKYHDVKCFGMTKEEFEFKHADYL